VTAGAWSQEQAGGGWIFRPLDPPPGILVAFSGRGLAPPEHPSPTAFLARRFADALALGGAPIVRPTQVHGSQAVTVRHPPGQGEVRDAGPCDALATDLPGVALVVQSADCVPIVLAGERAVGVVHAGWRGSAKNAAAAEVAALAALEERPENLCAWLGPAIGACCYEVGGDVAAQFAGQFARRSCNGGFRLDLAAVNRSQLEAAGVSPRNISTYPACTRCGGERFASYRRDGAASGRMIALVMRRELVTPASGPRSAR
jgi:YfiH family protein